MRKLFLIVCIGIMVFQIGVLSSCGKDFHFNGKYPPIRTIAITEHGRNYHIKAVSGHVIVIFKPTVAHAKAVQYIQGLNGKIISQTVKIRYYLVDAGSGNEDQFINQVRNNHDVSFAFLNTVLYPCEAAPQTHVVDNFYISHGNNVTYTLQECGLTTKINKYNVGIKDDESGGILSSEINSDLIRILNNIPRNTPAIINMSFGPAFVDLEIRFWTDKNITADIKNSYVKHYKETLKELIAIASFYKDKDFVIVKAAGNEGIKYLDEEILIDLARELSNADYQILNDHFVLVGAEDGRYPQYSNTVTKGNYNFLYTSVDISDLKRNNENLFGTSYAAPRVSCFISTTVNEHGIKATEALNAVKQITYKNPRQALTQEVLQQEAKKIAEINKQKSNDRTTNSSPEEKSDSTISNENRLSVQPQSVKNKTISNELLGTKWEAENKNPATFFSVVKSSLEFQENNQVEIINYFEMGSSEINYMYKYYFDTKNKEWLMYQTSSVKNILKMSEEEEKELAKRMFNYYVLTISKNVLTATDAFGKKAEYRKVF